MTTKFIFVTGGVVSSLGKGLAAASIGSLARGARLPGHAAEDGPLHQRGRRDHEPVPARRGLRDRRRRRDRSRPRPLRALHLGPDDPGQQRHYREGLRDRDREGAARRLSRPDRPGDPAHHRPDQGVDPQGGRRRRRGDHRDRGHRRRHRGPALPRGGAPVQEGRGQGQRHLRPPHAGAVHPGRAASSRPRPPSTRSRSCAPSVSSPTCCCAGLPRTIRSPRRSSPRSRSSATSRKMRSSPRATSTRSTRCRSPSTTRAWTQSSSSCWTCPPGPSISPAGRRSCAGSRRRAAAAASGWSASTSRSRTPTRASTRRSPTAASPTRRRSRSRGWTPSASSARGWPVTWPGSTASWCRAASATGVSRGRSRPSSTRASSVCRTSASASACSARSSSSRATCAGSRAPTPPSSTRPPRTT